MEKIKGTKEVKEIVKACFPDYKGRKFYLSTQIPSQIESYWSGGSRNFYAFYQLSTKKLYNISSNHPFFEKDNPRDLNKLPLGVILVKNSCFCGKWTGITFYINKEDLTPNLLR